MDPYNRTTISIIHDNLTTESYSKPWRSVESLTNPTESSLTTLNPKS